MADKKYFEFLDIPDGSGGSDRWHARDAEAQAGIAQVASAIGVDTDYEFVDLGLPSGTLWAKCNIGATEETGYGKYYMYGKGDHQYDSEDSAYTGTENPLDPTKDTATVVLGAPWHMPTKAQFEELIANTTYTWETNFNGSGINGAKFTAQNGNYIFIPAAGNYDSRGLRHLGVSCGIWSNTPYGAGYAYYLYADDEIKSVGNRNRIEGYSVRPVCDTAPLVKVSSKADKKDTYTKGQVDDMLNSVVAGSTAAELFTFEVDTATMNLHVYSTAAYANAFKVEDGVLKLDFEAMPTT